MLFFINSLLLGVGLAMDAFTVSIADSIIEYRMSRRRMAAIAGTFAFFQFIMPVAGWVLVKAAVMVFRPFETAIPWIALVLLAYIGVKMILESSAGTEGGAANTLEHAKSLEDSMSEGFASKGMIPVMTLILQGTATSIDALSAGFTIAEYSFAMAMGASLIIAAVTFAICLTGLRIGSTFGTKLQGKANIAGGIILILIGLEIFFRGILG